MEYRTRCCLIKKKESEQSRTVNGENLRLSSKVCPQPEMINSKRGQVPSNPSSLWLQDLQYIIPPKSCKKSLKWESFADESFKFKREQPVQYNNIHVARPCLVQCRYFSSSLLLNVCDCLLLLMLRRFSSWSRREERGGKAWSHGLNNYI
jgi:hypothetical protein